MNLLSIGGMVETRFGVSKILWAGLPLLIAPLLLFFSQVIYNLYFHPLRKYPGPLLARATGLWFIYYLWTGHLPQVLRVAHDKYGDAVRVSPNDLSYTDPRAWNDVYGHKNGARENEKDYRHVIREDQHEHIINSHRDQHSKLRRLLSHGFSDKALREQQPVVSKYIDLLMQRLHGVSDGGNASIDIVDWFNFTTFDIIGDLAFSEPFDCLSESRYHPWVKMNFQAGYAGGLTFVVSRIGIMKKLMKRWLIPRELVKARADNNDLVHEKLLRRVDNPPDYPDLMGNMVRAYHSGKLEIGDLSVNSRIVILAGSETTATLLSGVTYFLGHNPKALARLTAEIRDNFQFETDIDITTVSELPYLMAVLEESLRMFPPLPGSLVRMTPPEGAMICGDWIPGGTSVSISMLAMHYSERNFRDAANFRPERFLNGKGSQKRDEEKINGAEDLVEDDWANDRREALQPFSFGPRNCIGRNLAYMEMRLIIARLLWNFDLELLEGSPDYVNQRIFAFWEKGPLMVRLTPVQTASYTS